MANNEKKKKNKLLKIGLWIGIPALLIFVGYLLTGGSAIFVRNALTTLLVGGAGVLLGKGLVSGVKKIFSSTKNKDNSDGRKKNLERIPVYTEERTNNVDYVPSNSTENETMNRNTGR